jgi:hypothetical protein
MIAPASTGGQGTMDRFTFCFGFYALILGLAVTEITSRRW